MDENGRRDAFSNPANGGLQGPDWVTIFTYIHYETYTLRAILPQHVGWEQFETRISKIRKIFPKWKFRNSFLSMRNDWAFHGHLCYMYVVQMLMRALYLIQFIKFLHEQFTLQVNTHIYTKMMSCLKIYMVTHYSISAFHLTCRLSKETVDFMPSLDFYNEEQ